jgi:DtxR family Mn-dependent transcriptional regulator
VKNNLSYTEENYLKAIFSLSKNSTNTVSTNDLAKKLVTKASSITDMVKKLAEKKLVDYKKYQGVKLSTKGQKTAISIIRSHRLWEVFLVEHLSYRWDEVHEIAEQLEHVKSETLIDKLDEFLGSPEVDPHGDPIPDKEGNMISFTKKPLSELEINQESSIVGVRDSSDAFLKYLNNKGIAIGNKIKIVYRESFDKSLEVTLNKKKILITEEVAKNLFVKDINSKK